MSRVPVEYVPYGERPEWQDLTPIEQDDSSLAPLAPIMYGDEYKDSTNYFRAIVHKGEYSERVLEITEHIIRQNPSHYSVWQYRYDTLLAIKADLIAELELMDEIATTFLKTYQVWHHRRLLITHLRTPRPELMFIANALQADKKNYHTWAYRQWILAEFNEDELWDGELPFVEHMLSDDLRNNSAWHHRFFVVWESGVRAGEEDRETLVKREIAFTKAKISRAPNNASAWNYLRGFLERTSSSFSLLEAFVTPYAQPRSPEDESEWVSDDEACSPKSPTAESFDLAETADDAVLDLENPMPSARAELPCPQAIEFLADIREQGAQNNETTACSDIDEAIKLYASLATKYDTMRERYWEFRQREASKLILAIA